MLLKYAKARGHNGNRIENFHLSNGAVHLN